jgi:hypothetical protein
MTNQKQHTLLLSAAETLVLQQPNGNNSQAFLRTLLKEASLKGYIRSYKGHRMGYNYRLAAYIAYPLAIFGVSFGSVAVPANLILIALLGTLLMGGLALILPKKQTKDQWCIQLTEKSKRPSVAQERPVFKWLLSEIRMATRQNNLKNAQITDCAFAELLVFIKKDTPSGGEFLDKQVLLPLVDEGWLTVTHGTPEAFQEKLKSLKKHSGETQGWHRSELYGTPRHTYQRTERGNDWVTTVKAQLGQAAVLPRLIRNNPQQAKALALSLGVLVLLVPGMVGHFTELFQLIQPEFDETTEPRDPYGSDAGDVGSWGDSPNDNQDDLDQLDGGGDWDGSHGSSDLLDGDMDGMDAGFSDNAIGDGSDGGDGCSADGGCGGDGGGDGCGSGCGGCGGD